MWLLAWIVACTKPGPAPAPAADATYQADITAFGERVMVFETRDDGTRTVQTCGPLPRLSARSGSEFRLASCTSSDKVALPLEGPHVQALAAVLHPGAKVDMITTIEGKNGPETVTLVQGSSLDDRGWLLIGADRAELVVHAAARGQLAYSLQRDDSGTDPERMDTLIPAGMRLVATALPRGVAPTPFLRSGDTVDVIVATPQKAYPLFEGVMCFGADRLDGNRDRLALLLTPHDTQQFVHAVHTSTLRVALRHPQDTSTDLPELTELELPVLADARVPHRVDGPAAPRIRPGMRGIMIDADGVQEGKPVEVVGQPGTMSEELVLAGMITAAIAQRGSEHQVALLHAWSGDAVALTLAEARHGPLLARPQEGL